MSFIPPPGDQVVLVFQASPTYTPDPGDTVVLEFGDVADTNAPRYLFQFEHVS